MSERGIIIVGGGPVGLALALLLARREVSSTVIDARGLEVARSDQRLLALARGTVDLLRPLLDLPQEACAPIRTVVVSSAGEFGRVVIREDDLGIGPLGVTVRYGALVVPLAQACERCQRVSVLRPRRVMSLEQQPARVRLTLDDGSAVDAALAVNAEGTMVLTGQRPRQTGIVADVVVAGPAAGEAHERFTREGPLALLPTPAAAASDGRTLGMVWCMSADAAERRLTLDDGAFIAELQQAFGARHGRVLRAGARRAYPLVEQTRPSVRAHRTVWIGNAAQTLHPVAGQGLNLGMRDAARLADAIAHAVASGRDPAVELPDYEERRRADRGAIVALTRQLPGLFATRAAPIAIGRSVALAALGAIPELRREFARVLMFGIRT